MINQANCINCAAPLNLSLDKCEYCFTPLNQTKPNITVLQMQLQAMNYQYLMSVKTAEQNNISATLDARLGNKETTLDKVLKILATPLMYR